MAAIVLPAPKVRAGLPLGRWGFLVGVLLVELLALTFCFDSGSIARDDRWWGRLLGQSSQILRLGIAATVAAVLFRSSRLRAEIVKDGAILGPHRLWWVFLLAHLATFAVFGAITAVILGDDPRSLIQGLGGGNSDASLLIGPVWFVAWAVAGMTTLALWCAAVLPPRVWLPLSRLGASSILVGVAVGGLGWGAGLLTSLLWKPLSVGTFFSVSLMLRLAGLDVISDPEEFALGTPVFHVRIAPECSGYEGIGLIWAFLGAYLWLFRRELRFPRALLILPIGTVVIWVANSARIAALVILGTYGSQAVALGGFHSQAGWLAFNVVGLGLVIGSRRLRFFRTDDKTDDNPGHEGVGSNPTAAYLGPMLALLATMMITGAFSAGFDRLYPLRVIVSALVFWHYRREYTDLRRTWSWESAAIGLVVFGLWMALEPAPTAADPIKLGLDGLTRGEAWAWLAFRVVGSVVIVPLAEELAFRGFLIRRLIRQDFTEVAPGQFTWTSFVISSVLFGALHGRWLAGTLAGLLYAVALYRRRELSDAVAAHATTNGLIGVYVLATGSWSMWS